MSTESGDFRTPGQLIEALLAAKGWTKRVLAIVLDMDETGINRLVADKRPVDAPMALNLEALFGVPAERFLELQKSYDLAKARISAKPPDPGRATRAHLFGGLPIAEMIKRGWLDAETVRDVPKVESALAKFFGVKTIDEIEILPHAAKKTQVNTEPTPAMCTVCARFPKVATPSQGLPYSN